MDQASSEYSKAVLSCSNDSGPKLEEFLTFLTAMPLEKRGF